MHRIQLKHFDLNLLLCLDALLSTRHVSQAAEAMSLTQSGMSKNLSRLRDAFKDDLLVRAGNGMVLTPKAEQLAGEVKALLGSLEGMLTNNSFNAETTAMQFTVAASDFLMQLYIPDFLDNLLRQAPLMQMKLVGWSEHTLSQLESGAVDFLFGGMTDAPAGVYRKILNTSEYVCITRKHHPIFVNGFSLENYLKVGHVSLDLTGKGSNPVDDWLKTKGLTRRVVVKTPYFMSGVAMVSHSDLVMLAHAGLAERASKHYELDIFPLPFQLEMPPFGIFWHERSKNSAPHLWFRNQVVSLLN